MSQPWYKYPRIDDYASYPDPDGPFPKPDSNILVPDGVPSRPLRLEWSLALTRLTGRNLASVR